MKELDSVPKYQTLELRGQSVRVFDILARQH